MAEGQAPQAAACPTDVIEPVLGDLPARDVDGVRLLQFLDEVLPLLHLELECRHVETDHGTAPHEEHTGSTGDTIFEEPVHKT